MRGRVRLKRAVAMLAYKKSVKEIGSVLGWRRNPQELRV